MSGTTTLTFTLTNPNAGTALSGVGFTDTLPAGLVVATPNGLANTCGGTVTAVAGSGSIGLVDGGLAAGGSCTITVDVTGTTGGLKDNTTSAVTSTEGGTGGTAVAFLVVVEPPEVAPPTIAKAFGAASIVVNETTTLTFTLTNPNPGTALSGVGFTDTLPAGLVVATPNGLTNTCGGTVTAVAGSRQRGAGRRRPARRRLLHDRRGRHRHHGRRQGQHDERRHLGPRAGRAAPPRRASWSCRRRPRRPRRRPTPSETIAVDADDPDRHRD